MLYLYVKPGDKVHIGDAIIHVAENDGKSVRLFFDVDRSIPICLENRPRIHGIHDYKHTNIGIK